MTASVIGHNMLVEQVCILNTRVLCVVLLCIVRNLHKSFIIISKQRGTLLIDVTGFANGAVSRYVWLLWKFVRHREVVGSYAEFDRWPK